MKHSGHENKGNDHQLKKLLIVKQIFFSEPYEIYREIMENMHTDVWM